jgi:hypothetical protein
MQNMRKQSGNLLAVTSLTAAGFVASTLMALSFISVLCINNRLQSEADTLALFGANNLNVHNRIGQMNTIICQSRQLVFSARESLSDAQKRHPQLANFANEMLEEAQIDAQELEQERHRLQSLIEAEAKDAIVKEFQQRRDSFQLNLPWIKIGNPQLAISFGEQSDLCSNVKDPECMPDLYSFDMASGRLTDTAHYMKGHSNATLPGPDNYLSFHISKLTPSANGKPSVSHVISGDKFSSFDDTSSQLPSACRVSIVLDVAANKSTLTPASQLKTESSAVTAGALESK